MIFSDEYFAKKMSKVNAYGGQEDSKSSGGSKPRNTRMARNAARRTRVANLRSRTNKK